MSGNRRKTKSRLRPTRNRTTARTGKGTTRRRPTRLSLALAAAQEEIAEMEEVLQEQEEEDEGGGSITPAEEIANVEEIVEELEAGLGDPDDADSEIDELKEIEEEMIEAR